MLWAVCGPKGHGGVGPRREGIPFLHTWDAVHEFRDPRPSPSTYCRSLFAHPVGVTCWGTGIKYEGASLGEQGGWRVESIPC